MSDYITDLDSSALTYSVSRPNGTALPMWMGMNTAGLLSGTAAFSDNELIHLSVRTVDAYGLNLTLPLTLRVNSPPTDLYKVRTTIRCFKGKTYQYNFVNSFKDYNGDTMKFYITSNLLL